MNRIFVLSLLLASAQPALAESVSNPFDTETPGWVFPGHTTDDFGEGWKVLTGSWLVTGGQLRGNYPKENFANLLVYTRHGAGPDFQASVEITATQDSNEVVYGGIVFSLKDQNTFFVIRLRILGAQSSLQVLKNSLLDGALHEQPLVALNLLPAGASLEPGTTYKISIKAAGEGAIDYTLTDRTNGDVIAEGTIRDPEISNGGLVGLLSSAPYLHFGSFTAGNLTGKGLSIEDISRTNTSVAARPPVAHQNPFIVPAPRRDWAESRQALVLQRAKESPGEYDIEFIGDSITQGWEEAGANAWKKYYGKRKVINMGVTGERTEHVLWRFENGQLDGIKAKVAVVLIGTNCSGGQAPEADIVEGVTAVVQQVRTRQPATKILLLGIFPRGQTFSVQRGQVLQVNQALAKLADGKNIFYMDFGSQLIEPDGSISPGIMPDFLHLSERGYEIWGNAIEPKLKELL
jgi:beta-glucosidase